ncbi:FecR family protein [Pedobacter jeongneungensis]|uniref:FecR family protein n=1 Tax=Pedobacter jeongneungensis TaxID=947309 RepID=UPI00046810A6|nr:FecR domain-containing protein [Pedobacter jeongneungensis]
MQSGYNWELLLEIAHKIRNRKQTIAEQAYYDQWYEHFEDSLLELPEGYAANPLVIRDRMHQKLKARIVAKEHKNIRRLPLWIKLTAAAALFVILCGTLLYLNRPTAPHTEIPQIAASSVPPGTNRATLTLANGKTISLDQIKAGTIAAQAGTEVRKDEHGRITYEPGINSEQVEIAFNTISVPKGGQYQVKLADGTNVWLNAASTLKYPTSFADQKERTVELTGEGYFEVAKDKAHPFIVKTRQQEVTVLGTHFNINSYTDEANVITTLEEGRVKVTSGGNALTIAPGQRTVLSSAGNMQLQPADLESALAWKNGKIYFKNADIRSIMRQVSRWYNVDVVFEGKFPGKLYNGGIYRNSNLAAVLEILEESNIHFKLSEPAKGKKILTVRP